ncbi:MAG: SPOR domain-containing protein [Proteobacteria bacterium]|nr:SPOR domain-containing protein [Pseudomonadota bacterium]
MAKEGPKSKKSSKKKVQIQMTSFSILLWGICLFFLLGWIFLLGILVGRGFLPATVPGISELKDQINKLQEMITSNKTSGTKPNKKEEVDPKLAFYERLSTKKDEASHKEEESAKTQIGSAEKPQQKKMVDVKKEPNLKEGAKPPKREPESVAAPGGVFTVQLASLEEKSGAERMIKVLSEKGYEAYYYEAVVRGKTYFRIRCGRFTNRDEAEAFAKKLAVGAGVKGFVTGVE